MVAGRGPGALLRRFGRAGLAGGLGLLFTGLIMGGSGFALIATFGRTLESGGPGMLFWLPFMLILVFVFGGFLIVGGIWLGVSGAWIVVVSLLSHGLGAAIERDTPWAPGLARATAYGLIALGGLRALLTLVEGRLPVLGVLLVLGGLRLLRSLESPPALPPRTGEGS